MLLKSSVIGRGHMPDFRTVRVGMYAVIADLRSQAVIKIALGQERIDRGVLKASAEAADGGAAVLAPLHGDVVEAHGLRSTIWPLRPQRKWDPDVDVLIEDTNSAPLTASLLGRTAAIINAHSPPEHLRKWAAADMEPDADRLPWMADRLGVAVPEEELSAFVAASTEAYETLTSCETARSLTAPVLCHGDVCPENMVTSHDPALSGSQYVAMDPEHLSCAPREVEVSALLYLTRRFRAAYPLTEGLGTPARGVVPDVVRGYFDIYDGPLNADAMEALVTLYSFRSLERSYDIAACVPSPQRFRAATHRFQRLSSHHSWAAF